MWRNFTEEIGEESISQTFFFFLTLLICETFIIPLKRTAMIISLAVWRVNCVDTVRVQSTLDVSEPFVHSISTCVRWGSYHYLGAHPRCLDANWRGSKTAQRELLHILGLWAAFSGLEMTQMNLESSLALAHLCPAPLILPGHRNPSNTPGMAHEPGKSPQAQDTEVRISCNVRSGRWSHRVTAFWR